MQKEKISKPLLKEIINRFVLLHPQDGSEKEFLFNYSGTGWIFDFRRAFLQPKLLDIFARYFWDNMGHYYPFQIGGLEMGVIPLISAISLEGLRRGTPVSGFVVRKERKSTGLGNMIEGVVSDVPIIILDDLYNSGNSFLRVCSAIENIGKRPSYFFCFVNFMRDKGLSRLREKGVIIHYPFALGDFVDKSAREKEEPPETKSPQKQLLCALENANRWLIVPKSNPVAYEDLLIVAGEGGKICGIDKESGERIWEYRVGIHKLHKNILSSPIVIGDTVVFGSYDGNVYKLGARDGRLIWKNGYADFVGSSPCYSERHDLIYIGTEHSGKQNKGGLMAIDNQSGETVWFQPFAKFTHCSPGYSEQLDLVICGSNDGRVMVADGKTGDIKHDLFVAGEVKSGFAFSDDGTMAYFGSWDGGLYKLDLNAGSILFRFHTADKVYTTPARNRYGIFCSSSDKCFYHIDEMGSVVKKIETHGKILSSPAIVEEKLVVFGSNDGYIYAYDSEKQELITRLIHGDRITTKILVTGDDLYFSDHVNTVWRINNFQDYVQKSDSKHSSE